MNVRSCIISIIAVGICSPASAAGKLAFVPNSVYRMAETPKPNPLATPAPQAPAQTPAQPTQPVNSWRPLRNEFIAQGMVGGGAIAGIWACGKVVQHGGWKAVGTKIVSKIISRGKR